MKTSTPAKTSENRSPTFLRRLIRRFAAAAACLCVGGALLVPALTDATGSHRLPKGQLQADMKTLFAAIHYLFEEEPNFDSNPAWSKAVSLALAQPTNSFPFESSAGGSNSATAFGGSPPAQS